jgi:CBS domain-containing protein
MGRSRPDRMTEGHTMSVASILKVKGIHVEVAPPDTTLYTVVWTLKAKNIGAIVVSEDGSTVLGLVSERDIIRGLTDHGAKLLTLPVSKLMTSPVITCRLEESITAVMARMTRHRARHLPVVEGGKLCGIVSIGDVVKHRLDELQLEADVLRENLMTSH